MTKSELIEEVSRIKPDLSKRDVETIVNTIFERMTQALVRHDRIEIRGFGSFVAKPRRAREGRNPRTGEKVHVPQKWVPFFTVGKELRERINATAGSSLAVRPRALTGAEPRSAGRVMSLARAPASVGAASARSYSRP